MFKLFQLLSFFLLNTFNLYGCSITETTPVKQFSGATFGEMAEQQDWNISLHGPGNLKYIGFEVLHLDNDSLSLDRQELIQKIKHKCLSVLPSGYLSVEENTKFVHGVYARTFHRDVGMFSLGTSYPVFKALTYMNDGPLLSVVPGSHTNPYFKAEESFLISSTAGTIILNNADIVHAGAVNTLGEKRRLVGLTFCHSDDVKKVLSASNVKNSLEPNNEDKYDRGWIEDKLVETLKW